MLNPSIAAFRSPRITCTRRMNGCTCRPGAEALTPLSTSFSICMSETCTPLAVHDTSIASGETTKRSVEETLWNN